MTTTIMTTVTLAFRLMMIAIGLLSFVGQIFLTISLQLEEAGKVVITLIVIEIEIAIVIVIDLALLIQPCHCNWKSHHNTHRLANEAFTTTPIAMF